MGLNIGGKIERVDGRELTYKEFVERFLQRNQPVLLTGLMDGWRACSDWVTEDGLPNLHFFSDNFGKSIVQVADCCEREFTDQKRIEMSVSEFVSHWLGHFAADCGNGSSCNSTTQPLLYLKDWHFVKEYSNYVAYTAPPFFTDDWLNLYLDLYSMHQNSDVCHDRNEINCSDYRFVYMGAKGTWTPLHADVFRSYSWSANVCGKKQWYFLPPSQCHLLFDGYLKSSVYDVFDNVSEKMFPGFKKTVWWECTQEQNEIIFVPSGWHHQVHNLEDTISINHNWFNGYNLSWVWNLLRKDYNEAKNYIEDVREICDDFEGLCQRNLAANTGMNFLDFFGFIARFSIANLILLYNLKDEEDTTSSKVQHLVNSISSIRNVASNMVSVEAFAADNLHRSIENHSSYSDISKILEEQEFLELCLALNRMYELIDEPLVREPVTNITSLRPKGSLLMSHLKAGCGDFYFLKACGSKMNSPEDLIRLIDHALTNCSGVYSGCNANLLSDLYDLETPAVLEQNCL